MTSTCGSLAGLGRLLTSPCGRRFLLAVEDRSGIRVGGRLAGLLAGLCGLSVRLRARLFTLPLTSPCGPLALLGRLFAYRGGLGLARLLG